MMISSHRVKAAALRRRMLLSASVIAASIASGVATGATPNPPAVPVSPALPTFNLLTVPAAVALDGRVVDPAVYSAGGYEPIPLNYLGLPSQKEIFYPGSNQPEYYPTFGNFTTGEMYSLPIYEPLVINVAATVANNTDGICNGFLGYENLGGTSTQPGLFDWGSAGYNSLKIASGGVLNTQGSGAGGGTFVGTTLVPITNRFGAPTSGSGGGYPRVADGAYTTYLYFGGPSSGYGVVNVAGGTWNDSNSPLEIGYGGQGFVTVQSSGQVTVANEGLIIGQDSTGLPTSAQGGTYALDHLAAGIGTMVVQSGGALAVTGNGGYIALGRSASASGATGSLFVTGTGSTVNVSQGIIVGDGGYGIFAIESGGSVTSASGYIAGQAATYGLTTQLGSGTLIIDGSQSVWNVTGNLDVGAAGAATVSVQNSGNLNVSGTLTIGDAPTSSATVLVQAAGSLESASAVIAKQAGSTGAIAIVTGAGSIWRDSGTIKVGEGGTGILGVETGATLNSGSATLGDLANAIGNATATGVNTFWTVSGDMTVGNSGFGALTVSNNAMLTTTGDATIGALAGTGAGGTATITYPGTEWQINGELKVGDKGSASMSVENGGYVSLAGNLAIADSAGSNGTLILDGNGSRVIGTGTSVTIGGQGTGAMVVQNIADAIFPGAAVSLGEKQRGSGTLTVQDNGTVMSVGSITVGAQGTGIFNLLNSASLSTGTNVTLGENATGNGTATIDNAAMTDAGTLTVGGSGTGTLNIQNGGSLTVQGNDLTLGEQAGSSGTLSISGGNSALTFSGDVTVGKSGGGTFAVQMGGHFGGTSMTLASGTGFGGASTGGSGTLNITGAGSSVSLTQDLTVGKYGNASVAIVDGGMLSDQGDVTLGSQPGTNGSVTVDSASSWVVTGSLTIGSQGVGTATIKAGSSLLARGTSVTIGKSGGTGVMTVDGGKSVFQYGGDLIIGKASDGTLNLQAGAVTQLASHGTGDVYLAQTSGVHGTLNIDGGGSALAATDMVVGGTSSKVGGTGLVDLTNGGALTVSQTLTMWKGSSINTLAGSLRVGTASSSSSPTAGNLYINNNGELAASGSITGNVIESGGTFSVGGGKPGILSIAGDFSQSAGILKVASDGTASGDFSQLNATGTVAITGGTIEFDFVNGYAPKKGDTFQFIDPPQSVGISNVNYTYTGLAPGFLFNVTSNSNGLSFTALNNAVAGTTPEPAGLALLGLGAGLLLLRRRWRRPA